MINPVSFIYSMAAAARMLGVKVSQICGFHKWWKVCWVWVKGQRPTFISLSAFRLHFVERRQQEAKHFLVTKLGSQHYQVANPYKDTNYKVWAFHDGLDCECEDYKNQVKFLGKACCKHCYAVLNTLGFDRLSDYIEHHQWLPTG